MPLCLQCVPYLFARITLEDTEERRHYVENKDRENTDSDCNHHWQVSFNCGPEYSGILEKNREFDEENGETVEDITDIVQLVSFLADDSQKCIGVLRKAIRRVSSIASPTYEYQLRPSMRSSRERRNKVCTTVTISGESWIE